jgi:four helix bundle protein
VADLDMELPRLGGELRGMTERRMHRAVGGNARVVRLVEAFVACCDRLERELGRRQHAHTSHIRAAAASIQANTGEAFGEQSMGDKRRFFRYALRSATECEHLLRGLRKIAVSRQADVDQALRLVRDIRMDLLRLIRWASRPPP